MARTQTQKALRKAQRTGTWCPEQSRRVNGDYGALSQHVRVMPSKQEKQNKVKHKKRIIQDGGASFYMPRGLPLNRCIHMSDSVA